MLNFASHHVPEFRLLSDEQIQEIHLATLEILERTGSEIKDSRAREMLRKAGARVVDERVYIPAHLVEWAVQTAPERVMMCSRTGERSMPLERNKVFFGTGSDTPNTIDPYSRERRRSRANDVKEIARLCDALPNIDFVMSMAIASDKPSQSNYLYGFAGMAAGSSKPMVFTAHDLADMEQIYEMAVAVAGSEDNLRANPFLLHYDEPISPLIHSPNGVAKLIFCAENMVPVTYVTGMLIGATAPATLAGACAMANAECLAALVIHQLAKPGAPFVYGANVVPFDMRNATASYAGPEFVLSNAAFAELSRFYRLPVWGLAGSADSKLLDAQAGAEAMIAITSAIMARGNLVHDVGYLEYGLTSSMEMILYCTELIEMVRTYAKGITCDDVRLAVDLIHEVGPGGHFLDTDHTVKYFRSEHFMPKLMERRNYDAWAQAGGKEMVDKLNERVLEILESHQPAPLSSTAQEAIDKVLARADGK